MLLVGRFFGQLVFTKLEGTRDWSGLDVWTPGPQCPTEAFPQAFGGRPVTADPRVSGLAR